MSKVSFRVKKKEREKPVRNDIWVVIVTWATWVSMCIWLGTIIDGGTGGANTSLSPTAPRKLRPK